MKPVAGLGLVAVAAISLSACITPQGTAKTRAANDFQCAEDGVTVTNIGGTSYRAEGCGKTAVYNCAASDAQRGTASNYACIPESPPNAAANAAPAVQPATPAPAAK
jgi:hypothetical protein